MMSINLSDIAILNTEGSDYRCIISLISKNEAISISKMLIWPKERNITKHKHLLPHIKLVKEILTFGYTGIKRNKFYRNKTPIFIKNVDIEKVLVSIKIFFGEKKTINTLLVTCIMIITLNHYI